MSIFFPAVSAIRIVIGVKQIDSNVPIDSVTLIEICDTLNARHPEKRVIYLSPFSPMCAGKKIKSKQTK